MKNEEIEKLAEQLYPISPNPQQIIEGFERVAFKKGYTQCQDDMAEKLLLLFNHLQNSDEIGSKMVEDLLNTY